MSRRDAIHRVASRSARLCKKNEKTAIGMIVTTTAVKPTSSRIAGEKTTGKAATKPLVTP